MDVSIIFEATKTQRRGLPGILIDLWESTVLKQTSKVAARQNALWPEETCTRQRSFGP